MELGARVIFITGKSAYIPAGAEVYNVTSASEMEKKFKEKFYEADIAIGAAAVGDFTPERKKGKIKRDGSGALTLELKPTADIMAWAGKNKAGRFLAGYAAQSGEGLEDARKKIKAKNLDMIVYNDISKKGLGFDSNDNEVTVMDKKGSVIYSGRESKEKLAGIIMGLVFEKAEKR